MAEVISEIEYYSPEARRSEISKYTASKLLELIRGDAKSVLVATNRGSPVGFCISTYDDGLIWLAWFGVARSQRSRQIGSQLLDAAVDLVRPRGCHKIWCDSRTSNMESRSVLIRAGFREICRVEKHWYGHDFWLWEKFV
jgi:ribosomal protein S18 acetylase RimI-like enzyme